MTMLFLAVQAASAATLAFAPDDSAATQVTLTEGGATVVLERFAGAETGVGTEVSPDGKWAYSWHKPSGKSQQVSIYNVQTHQRTAVFAPGFGGELHFSPQDALVLTHGCGSNCAVLTVFDLGGKTLLDIGGAQIDVSPSRKYAITYPSADSEPCPISLYDLGTGHRLAEFGASDEGDLAVDYEIKWAPQDAFATLKIVSKDNAAAPPRMLRVSADGTSSWVP